MPDNPEKSPVSPEEVWAEVRNGYVSLKEHVEAVMDEQRRGMLLAAEEREKAAQALRTELERNITQGDQALREHIQQQVQQIQAAFVSAELLEIQRFESLKREMSLITSAAQTAIDKLAEQYEKRFEQMNEWRAQSADRERSQQEETAKLTGTFMLREVGDSKIGNLEARVNALAGQIAKLI